MIVGTVADSNQPAGHFFSDNWIALLLGGSLLEGVYATFWFTTCLFFVQKTQFPEISPNTTVPRTLPR
jgi:hypothetical protein